MEQEIVGYKELEREEGKEGMGKLCYVAFSGLTASELRILLFKGEEALLRKRLGL